MLTLPLDPTDDRANPVFKDAAGCAKWLSQFQLTNLQLAHGMLYTQLSELNRFPMRGLERMNILELLRETIGYVQDDFAKKLIAKPLPLNESELMVFVAIVQLWQAMVTGYQRCLQDYMAGDKQLARHAALLTQRCLTYSGLEIFEHLRTGYEFEPKLWHQLHALYAFAEEQGFHADEVSDPLNPKYPKSSCRNIYVKTLLSCYARPAELTRSQLQLLDGWLTQWSSLVTVDPSYAASKGDAQPLAVDLASKRGLHPLSQVANGESIRYLPMVPISKLLRVKTILLQQGQSPRQANLCDMCSSQDCIEFLSFLHRCWCEDNHIRFAERRPVAQHAHICYRIEGIYAHLTGQAFRQPGRGAVNPRQIETGVTNRSLHDAHNKELLEMGFPLETWDFENESITGARLIRSDLFGGRLNYNQLLGLRPSDAEMLMLGVVAWANVSRDGKLQIGVRYLPGSAEPVALRPAAGKDSPQERYVPAFLLPPIPAMKIPASLVIPREIYQPDRVVEILHPDSESDDLQLGISVERGVDYERVSFSPLS